MYVMPKRKFGEKIKDTLEILKNTKLYKNRIYKELEERLKYKPTNKQINWCYWDFLKFRYKYKGSLETDYFGTQLYKKSDFVRQESFATDVRNFWRNAVQDKKYWTIFQNKCEFYTSFSKYLGRKWMIYDANTSWDDVCNFIKQSSQKVFTKVAWGCGGKGVLLWNLKTKKEKEEFKNYCKNNIPLILEEKVEQCSEIYSFSNYTSVNTFRIITIIDKSGKAHVARACMRMGGGYE